jgi:transglutaminase/protease-like cytokinesis protein 3
LLAAISAKLVDEAQSHTNDWSVEEETIRLIRTYVSDYIEDEYIYFEVTDSYVILEEKKGDCTEHTDLFNALLKAAGIPARNASGYLLADDSGAFSGHAWNEVAYDGIWVPVDATWDVWVENSVNHLKTVNGVPLSIKNFKLKLHKIEYHDGSSAMYN